MNARLTDVQKEFPERFAILMSSEAIGGLERYVLELAIAMRKSTSCEPIVLNLKRHTPYEADLRAAGVSLHSGLATNRFSIRGLLTLRGILDKVRPDALMISANRQAMLPGVILARMLRIPVTIIYTHDSMGKHVGTLRASARLADAIVAASPRHRTFLLGLVKRAPILTVTPGVNTDRTAALRGRNPENRTNSPVVGIIAALRPEKDHGTFLRAAAAVKRRLPRARFLIVGDGSMRASLERLAGDLRLGDSAEFLGWKDVDADLLGRFDVLVLSSLSETFPAVIIEAFSAGVPVVATDVGSVADLVESEENGILVPPCDPDRLAAAVLKILQDPQLAVSMSAGARARALQFTADRFCSEMLAVTRQLRATKMRLPTGTGMDPD